MTGAPHGIQMKLDLHSSSEKIVLIYSRRNEENRCYCLKEEGFKCLKSGVLNMAPCKRTPDMPEGAPLAVSYPHFYQAHPDYLQVQIFFFLQKSNLNSYRNRF
jgi:hypothetical protein